MTPADRKFLLVFLWTSLVPVVLWQLLMRLIGAL